jgi:hypothetical protein
MKMMGELALATRLDTAPLNANVSIGKNITNMIAQQVNHYMEHVD